MNSTPKQRQIKTSPPTRKNATPRFPHERDESYDSQSSGPRKDIKQAYDDVTSGQVDTDLRDERGVDAVLNKTPGRSPTNPLDVPNRTTKK
jgi:hypothetical protein